MLDTNVISAIMRHPAGTAARRIAELAEPVSISVIVAAELRYGAAKRGSDRLTATVEQLLDGIDIEPLSPPVDRIYGQLREALEREGRPMDANDLLIAAHALSLGRILATADHAFARVNGLTVENWLA
jgi:tRNA(fMet)-specific endonuclease VapC